MSERALEEKIRELEQKLGQIRDEKLAKEIWSDLEKVKSKISKPERATKPLYFKGYSFFPGFYDRVGTEDIIINKNCWYLHWLDNSNLPKFERRAEKHLERLLIEKGFSMAKERGYDGFSLSPVVYETINSEGGCLIDKLSGMASASVHFYKRKKNARTS